MGQYGEVERPSPSHHTLGMDPLEQHPVCVSLRPRSIVDETQCDSETDGILFAMVFKLNPHHPVVWRTPNSLQIGIDIPLAALSNVNRFEERALTALSKGISRGGLEIIAQECGLDDSTISALLERLKAAIITTHPVHAVPPLRRVALDGTGKTVECIRTLLHAAHFDVIDTHTQKNTFLSSPEIVVIVSHFVTEPFRHARWLRRDIPHIPIVFSDASITIGPLVEPGEGPCIHCRYRLSTARQRSNH
jgi:hypothetical protein